MNIQQLRQHARQTGQWLADHAAAVDIDAAQALTGLLLLTAGVAWALSLAIALIVLGILLVSDAVWSRR